MSIQMIVTDLDCTLLRSDKTLSDDTVRILRQCQAHGIKVVFATARPKRTVIPYFDQVQADAVIAHNGAVIHVGEQTIHHCGIASDIKNDILLSISKDYPEVRLSVEINDILYANFDVTSLWNGIQQRKTDFTDLPDLPAEKIIIRVSSLDEMARYTRYLPENLYLEMNEELGLIMHVDATKHAAVARLADYFHCSLNETVAFGDNFNDVGMVRRCGIGVAVGNALDEVKAAADEICESNDNDGVARWLEANVLSRMAGQNRL
ncbi:MAG: HAD family hydrolase [Clostridia bacterium]|nr:HAD family hydrolase [Clostridia bacterium]